MNNKVHQFKKKKNKYICNYVKYLNLLVIPHIIELYDTLHKVCLSTIILKYRPATTLVMLHNKYALTSDVSNIKTYQSL